MWSKIVLWWHGIWTGTPVYIAGQVLGLLIIFVSMAVYIPKERRTILRIKFSCDILNSIQYAMIGAYTGALLNFVSLMRETVLLSAEGHRWARSKLWFVFFVLCVWISPCCDFFLFGGSWLVFLPAVGSTIAVVGFFRKNPIELKWLALAACIPWVVYAVIVSNIGALICNVLVICATVFGIVKWYVKDGKE